MREYIDCGIRLGWLINPDAKQVEIYRQGQETEDERPRAGCGSKGTREVLDNPQTLSGEDVMPNLLVSLEDIFD